MSSGFAEILAARHRDGETIEADDMDYFQSDGLKLAYRVVGEGEPIVLVHGFASTHEVNWVARAWREREII